MRFDHDTLRAMERVHVKAWPATETADLNGWLWRWSGGGSQRANSVSTVDYTGADVDAAIADMEARYRAKGVPARFHTFDAGAPAGLAARLQARGYEAGETTLTLIKPAAPRPSPHDVETTADPTEEWLSVYLGAITPNRREVNRGILARIPGPRAFFVCRRDGHVISTALSVIGFGCAVVECVATTAEARRQGGADAVMAALESWAATQDVRWIGLQVVEANAPARALYRRLGYETACANRFFVRENP